VTIPNSHKNARLIIIMGVTGCGKSTKGEQLSLRLNATYIEGDSYHTLENKHKMAQGIALNDADRWPWLKIMSETLSCESQSLAVGSCSALKRSYREFITKIAKEPVLFVYLKGSRSVLARRLAQRTAHFMNPNLLDSQLATLEPPAIDEYSFTVDIDNSITDIVEQVAQKVAQ